MKVYSIPGKLDGEWRGDAKAMVDTWTSYTVSKDEFRAAVLGKGVPYAQSNKVVGWIVDSSKAVGTFSQEIQDFIGKEVFPAFAKAGVKYFITISPKASALTKMTVSSYSAKTGPNGLQLVEVDSAIDAIAWLKAHA